MLQLNECFGKLESLLSKNLYSANKTFKSCFNIFIWIIERRIWGGL